MFFSFLSHLSGQMGDRLYEAPLSKMHLALVVILWNKWLVIMTVTSVSDLQYLPIELSTSCASEIV